MISLAACSYWHPGVTDVSFHSVNAEIAAALEFLWPLLRSVRE